MRAAYLDNNATAPVLPQVAEAMISRYTDGFGNPSSLYRRGRDAKAAIEEARASVARLFGCDAAEVVFTSGGTEADDAAILGLCESGDHIITTAIEHDAVLNSCRAAQRLGCTVTRIMADSSGRIDPEEVHKALRPNTKLISVMAANNETGVLQPIEEIGQIAAEADVWFHTDAVQAAGKIPLDVKRIGCDLLSISAHKIHGPQGVGALYLRRGTPLQPILHGGHQERGHRAGTENLPGIVGLGIAAAAALSGLKDGTMERIAKWRDRMEQTILAQIGSVEINGGSSARVGNTSSLFIDYIGSDTIVLALDKHGISISAGSACSAGTGEPSHVLVGMGLGAARARSSIRISIGKLNEETDIDHLLSVLPKVVKELRQASPLYRKHVAMHHLG